MYKIIWLLLLIFCYNLTIYRRGNTCRDALKLYYLFYFLNATLILIALFKFLDPDCFKIYMQTNSILLFKKPENYNISPIVNKIKDNVQSNKLNIHIIITYYIIITIKLPKSDSVSFTIFGMLSTFHKLSNA